MAGSPQVRTAYRVHCPHCNKLFQAELIEGDVQRHRGFKCPHCKLFVAFERAEELGRTEEAV